MTNAQLTLQLWGRSSSHFTRVTRIFAAELAVPLDFRPILDLTGLDASAYAGNPALKIPILVDEQGPLFGTENICRALLSRSALTRKNVILRGDVSERVVANAEELTLHVMSSGVSVLMSKMAGGVVPDKVALSIQNSLWQLDETVGPALNALPRDRLFSFLEVSLFCVVTHLEFREIADTTPFPALLDFCRRFGERESAKATPYRFDAA